MGRKSKNAKKPQHQNQQYNDCDSGNNATSGSNQTRPLHSPDSSDEDHRDDVLLVQLPIPSQHQHQQQQPKQQPTNHRPSSYLIIHETDAKHLHIANDDFVFIGTTDDDIDNQRQNGEQMPLLLRAQIVGTTTTTTTSTSYSTPTPRSALSTPRQQHPPSRSKNNKTSITPGTVQITTDECERLWECLLPFDNHHQSTATPQQKQLNPSPDTTVAHTTPTSSSSETVSALFRNLAITNHHRPTSPGMVRTPSSSSTKRNNYSSSSSFVNVWITPLHSPFGNILQKVFCQHANKIVIQHTPSSRKDDNDFHQNPTNIPKEDLEEERIRKVQERLVIAYYCDRYVRMIPNQPQQQPPSIRISFRGKTMEFLLADAFSDNEYPIILLEELQQQMNKDFLIIIFIKKEPPAPADTETTTMTRNNDWKWRYWYRISHETRVEIVTNEYAGGSNNDNVTVHRSLALSDPITNNAKSKQWVAGLDATLEQLQTLLWTPLIRPELFGGGDSSSSHIKPPRGLLLYGPSGVGKTCLAKQVLSNLSMIHPSISSEYVHCASLQSQATFVGVAERNLQRMFTVESNRNDRRKLLVFDDIHLIAPRRGDPQSMSTGSDRMMATLLALLDGIGAINNNNQLDDTKKRSTVVILGITSNPSMLDPALRRPGRLDVEIEVPIPDEASTRAEILKFQLKSLGGSLLNMGNEKLMDEDDWLELAKLAKGFNGADCMLAVKEAMRNAILEESYIIKEQSMGTGVERQQTSHSSSEVLRVRVEHLRTAIRSIKPSAIKSVATVEIPRVEWSSIGGMESVKRELREAIESPLSAANGEWLERLRVPPPRGILLYGPPGCSKTLMARALATEGRMNFLAVKGPELLSKWLGESERALASLFRRARMASPSIIFFDEIDAIASKRGGFGDNSAGSSSSRLLSQLLTELDGVNHPALVTSDSHLKKQARVVVVGATNRPDLLDNALTRPGRIDRMIYVGVPDCESRARILEITLGAQSSLNDDIDIPFLASDEISHGFSGAEMVAICRDAALLALEESDTLASTDSTPKIAMRHLLQATKDMQRQITPEMLEFYNSYRERSRSARVK